MALPRGCDSPRGSRRTPFGRRSPGSIAWVPPVIKAVRWRRVWSVWAWETKARSRTVSGSSQRSWPTSEMPLSHVTCRVMPRGRVTRLEVRRSCSSELDCRELKAVLHREQMRRHLYADGRVGLEGHPDVRHPDFTGMNRLVGRQQPGFGQPQGDGLCRPDACSRREPAVCVEPGWYVHGHHAPPRCIHGPDPGVDPPLRRPRKAGAQKRVDPHLSTAELGLGADLNPQGTQHSRLFRCWV